MKRLQSIAATISSLAARMLASVLSIQMLPAETDVKVHFGRVQRIVEVEPGTVVVLERRLGRKRRGILAGPTERGVLAQFYAVGTYRMIAPPFMRVHRVPVTEQTLIWG